MIASGRVKYSDLVDIPKLQALMESFSNVIGIANAVIDVDGNMIARAGWQEACTAFHRGNAQTCSRCIESDTALAASMTRGAPFAIYRCHNGLIDAAAPIVLDGRHVASVFTGQVLTEPPDVEFFRRQARRAGFDEAAYLAAIAKVPVLPAERLESITLLYARLAAMLAENGLTHLDQLKTAQALAELNRNLEQKVESRTLALEAAYAELAERENALRESDEVLRRILGATLDGFWRIDCQGNLLDVNTTYCQLSGYTREELIGMRIPDLDAMKSPAEIAHLIRYNIEQGHAQFESRHRRKDGSVWPVEISTVYRDVAGGEILAFFRDITQRQQAEEARTASEQRFRDLVNTTDGIVWEADIRNFAITFISGQAERLLGYPLADMAKPGFWATHCIHPEDSEWVLKAILAARNRPGPFSLEHRFLGSAGNTGWVRAIITVVSENGAPRWLRGILVDITEQKRREAELIEAKAAAERANNAKSRFLAAASHDLRQPLSALSLLVGVLEERVKPADGKLVRNIQGCVDSLTELLTDLLDISKLEAGVVNPMRSDFAIDDLLAELASIYGPEARLKGLRLRMRYSGEGTYTDRQLLRRILGNLLANALCYTQRGGVLIGCRHRNGKRWVEVWDSGIGISSDQTEIIFEEFRQLGDDARNRGSGLGLSIVLKAATLLGLQIRLRSRPGHGSLFAIELPEQRECPSAAASAARPVLDASPCRIALVDDNARVLESLVMGLTASGHAVVAAATGNQLLKRLENRAPDIVISDFRIAASETGFDVIAAVRRAFGDRLPALLITGDTTPDLIRAMADRGIAVLYKPLRMDTLRAAIGEAMERKVA